MNRRSFLSGLFAAQLPFAMPAEAETCPRFVFYGDSLALRIYNVAKNRRDIQTVGAALVGGGLRGSGARETRTLMDQIQRGDVVLVSLATNDAGMMMQDVPGYLSLYERRIQEIKDRGGVPLILGIGANENFVNLPYFTSEVTRFVNNEGGQAVKELAERLQVPFIETRGSAYARSDGLHFSNPSCEMITNMLVQYAACRPTAPASRRVDVPMFSTPA